MTTRIQHRRSLVAGTPPDPPLLAGELAVNVPDLQLFTSDTGTPLPLLGVRRFAPTAKYLANDLMTHGGGVFVAKVETGPKAFDPADWTALIAQSGNFVLPDGTAGAPGLVFSADTDTGLYRAGANDQRLAAGGVDVLGIAAAGVTAYKTLMAQAGVTLADDQKLAWGDGSTYVQGSGATDILSFGTAGAEKVRITATTDRGELLVGVAASKWTQSATGLVEIAGASSAILGIDVAGAPAACLSASATGASIATVGGRPLVIYSDWVESARFDQRGNVGIGTAPSAWAGAYRALDLYAGGSFMADASGGMFVGANWYYNGTADTRKVNGAASRYMQYAGTHEWHVGPSGAAGAAIPFTTAMKLTAAGELCLGITSPIQLGGYNTINVNGSNGALLQVHVNGGKVGHFYGSASGVGMDTWDGSYPLNFHVGGALRMKITNTAIIDVGNGNQELGWRDMPVITIASGNYTAVPSDRGKVIQMGGAGSAFTIPSPYGSIVAGSVFTVHNTSAGNISLLRDGANTAIRWGTGSPIEGNRTLASNGIATFYLIAYGTYALTGSGIS